jgi:hypothetical protein
MSYRGNDYHYDSVFARVTSSNTVSIYGYDTKTRPTIPFPQANEQYLQFDLVSTDSILTGSYTNLLSGKHVKDVSGVVFTSASSGGFIAYFCPSCGPFSIEINQILSNSLSGSFSGIAAWDSTNITGDFSLPIR